MDLVLLGVSTFIPLIVFTLLVLIGSSNAVNLTDGLDGLASGLVIIAASALTVLTYVTAPRHLCHLSGSHPEHLCQ